ncbi:alpha/beta hydrolase [Winogradskyella sp. DF17]|uniref:Alpha/beta hydrolase n=1 Tax=Winogradskyella pelagia TaxID=2819984 RepID=A0ABS3T422_9FLAO|nr:alpha/beta hydrolase [Winogradskyella sp. DF17]MBO3117497.1 alpha/beta hydrolase [Winogradskyella sp. DF17]
MGNVIIIILVSVTIVICLACSYVLFTYVLCSWANKEKIYSKKDFPLYAVIKEMGLQCLIFFAFPFEFIGSWRPYDAQTNKTAIILPGYTLTPIAYRKLFLMLRKHGVGYKIIRYKPFTGDLNLQVSTLNKVVSELVKKNPHHNITLIGHSMGGLIAKKAMTALEMEKNINLITLSTPHKGTKFGRFGFGVSSNQMIPNSSFINSITEFEKSRRLNIFSNGDNLICPKESLLTCSKNILVRNVTLHNSILFDDEALSLIKNNIIYGRTEVN